MGGTHLDGEALQLRESALHLRFSRFGTFTSVPHNPGAVSRRASNHSTCTVCLTPQNQVPNIPTMTNTNSLAVRYDRGSPTIVVVNESSDVDVPELRHAVAAIQK